MHSPQGCWRIHFSLPAALWRLFSERRRAREGGEGKRGVGAGKREWNLEAFGSAVVKESEWEQGPCSQPHGQFSLGIMGAFLWLLTPLSHAGNGQPSARRSQQTRSATLTRWIIEFYTQESHPFPWSCPLLHVALTGTLPGSTFYPMRKSDEYTERQVSSVIQWTAEKSQILLAGLPWNLVVLSETNGQLSGGTFSLFLTAP